MADTEAVVAQLGACAENQNFEEALKLVQENRSELAKSVHPEVIKDALKKTTKDRLLLSFLDSVDFAGLPFDEALVALEKLVSFAPGSLVLSKAWGLGTVRKADYFYRRITVDFRVKKGHQFTYAAAIDTLVSAPEDHILVFRQADPTACDALVKNKPGEFIKRVLKSYGDLPITRLEDVCVQNGFVKTMNWKAFWDKARAELKSDKFVEIPAKRADPIRLKASVEDYGDGWLTAFAHETDPKLILAAVREYVQQGKLKEATEATRAKINERLVFAVTAARKVDDALYAQLACLVTDLGFMTPPASEMRAYLWERKRFIKAAQELPAREVSAMISFLASCDAQAQEKLYKAIPELCFAAVTEIVNQFGELPACRAAVGAYMKDTQAPATLTTLIVGKIEQFGKFTYEDVSVDDKKIRVLKSYAMWDELPSVVTLLAQAIALGEGRRSGETLKMQNLVRRLFGDKAWLEKMFKLLSFEDQVLFFERFQASIAWNPATHHTTVIRMTKIVPALEARLVHVEKKKTYARVTSPRSFGLKKQEYLKLINEEMPANIKRIEFAKGFGDLSENAEYQYAKDEQRALLQKQTVMQAELDTVKPSDFADATTDEVMPGVTVVIAASDSEKIWTILGEWDNDIDKGILSSQTRVAQNMMGKKIGDNVELPDENGNLTFATIKEIRPLSDDIREWMKLPVGVQM